MEGLGGSTTTTTTTTYCNNLLQPTATTYYNNLLQQPTTTTTTFFVVETKIVLAYFSRGSVATGGPTASRTYQNWRVPGAGAAPNPEEEPGSVPVPGGVGCFRAEKLQQFFL